MLIGRAYGYLQRLIEKSEAISQADGMRSGICLVVWSVLFALAAGCAKNADDNGSTSNSVTPDKETGVPTHGQAKLPTMKIYLGSEKLDAELALSQRQEQIGMMFRTNIQETDSMLFILPVPQLASFWMTNCPESLSAAYISPDGVIEEIHHLEKNDCNPVYSTNTDVQFVLEVKDGWFARHNINPGTVIRTDKGSLPETFLQK